MSKSDQDLPHEMIQQITEPLTRFLKIEAAAGTILLGAMLVAVAVTNSVWSSAFSAFWEMNIGIHLGTWDLSRPLRGWINDGLMTLFFFVVALELKRELVRGELRSFHMAMLPLAGALGGMLFPALLYLFVMRDTAEVHGWGTVMATDTAFMIACLAILGRRIPSSLRLFLLSLAIFDDVGAILVVAFGYGHALDWTALGFGLAGFIAVAGFTWMGVRSSPVYSLFGVAIWFCVDVSGLHPTIVGVVLGLMTPARGWVSDERLRFIFGKVLSYPSGDHWSGDTVDRHDLRLAGTAARETLSPVERLEIRLHPWVGFGIMPVFALANAGVALSPESLAQPLTYAIIFALVCGKPLGVISMSWLAVRLGLATLFAKLNWSLIAGGSLLTGIGFTMSLFIAGLAFTPSSLDAAKTGILAASLISAAAGLLALTVLSSRTSRS
ncbi:MAG TPA: Na+/H+ antiporter NhaA [Oligoflexus sp.]|uniref:Na+/H+ antiporter NhaA n=1 Tax=Oligoflexus sp. TaxID=1971216 RepID=UPI002D7EA90A|nr:Na+/H+ antiporter NhaA [Oligoflexus sp.]HET9241544.1 Na+/H+ antiporter NhaA [Oligoflexus sp.]